MTDIHPTAVLYPGAFVGAGTTVGPFSVLGPNVKVGKNNRIGSHVVIDGFTTLGDENAIFQFASIGAAPQDLKYHGEPSRLEIGNRNTIREFATLQPGTEGGGMLTSVGDQNLFMVSSHVGHDCRVGSGNVFANSVALAGHVTVGAHVILGGLSAVHQYVRLGDFSFLGGGSMVSQDVPPFCMVEGNRAGLVGLNSIGLERHGFSSSDIERLKKVFRALFLDPGVFRTRLQEVRAEAVSFEAGEKLISFIEASARGVCSARKRQSRETLDTGL